MPSSCALSCYASTIVMPALLLSPRKHCTAHLEVVIVVHVLREHVAIEGLPVLIHRRLAPAARLEAKGCPWRDGRAEPRHLQTPIISAQHSSRPES